MEKKKTLAVLALFTVVISLAGAGFASAYRGDYSVKGPDYSEEREALMEQAFETGNYAAWLSLMTQDGRQPRVVDVVTEDNFETFVQAHEAGKSGDSETASQLRSELGLGNGQGMNGQRGQGMGTHNGAGFGKGKGSKMMGSAGGLRDGSCLYDY